MLSYISCKCSMSDLSVIEERINSFSPSNVSSCHYWNSGPTGECNALCMFEARCLLTQLWGWKWCMSVWLLGCHIWQLRLRQNLQSGLCFCAQPTCHCSSAGVTDEGARTVRACPGNVMDLYHGIGWNGQMSVNVSQKCLQNYSWIKISPK